MCVRVLVWGKWEAYFTPFAAAHQNKHKQMRVSVLLSLGSATPQLGLLPPSPFPPLPRYTPLANEANVLFYVTRRRA